MAKKTVEAPDLGAALARARTVGEKLGAATDRLNAALEKLEEDLTGLNLGVTAAVQMEREFDAENGVTFIAWLRFGKDNRSWKLLYETELDVDESTFTSSPLLNASREVRLKAVGHLPALVRALVTNAEEEIADVQAKAEEAEAVALAVRNGGAR